MNNSEYYEHGDPCIPVYCLDEVDGSRFSMRGNTELIVEDGWVVVEGDVPCCIRKSELRELRSSDAPLSDEVKQATEAHVDAFVDVGN